MTRDRGNHQCLLTNLKQLALSKTPRRLQKGLLASFSAGTEFLAVP